MARVQSKGKNNGAASTAIAIGAGDGLSTVTAGNLLVLLVGQFGGAPGAPTFTDNLGSTYTTKLSSAPRGSLRMTMAYLPNAPSGITTITTTPANVGTVMVIEYSGVAAAPAVVAPAAYTDQVAVTSFVSNPITTTKTSLLVGFACCIFTPTAGFAASGAWSQIADFANTTDGDDAWCEEQLSTVAGIYNAAGTCTSNEISTGIVSFELAGATAAVRRQVIVSREAQRRSSRW